MKLGATKIDNFPYVFTMMTTPHDSFLMFKNCSNYRNAEELTLFIFSFFKELRISDLPLIGRSLDHTRKTCRITDNN